MFGDYRGFGGNQGTRRQAGLLDQKYMRKYQTINVDARHRSDVSPQRLVLYFRPSGGADILDIVWSRR